MHQQNRCPNSYAPDSTCQISMLKGEVRNILNLSFTNGRHCKERWNLSGLDSFIPPTTIIDHFRQHSLFLVNGTVKDERPQNLRSPIRSPSLSQKEERQRSIRPQATRPVPSFFGGCPLDQTLSGDPSHQPFSLPFRFVPSNKKKVPQDCPRSCLLPLLPYTNKEEEKVPRVRLPARSDVDSARCDSPTGRLKFRSVKQCEYPLNFVEVGFPCLFFNFKVTKSSETETRLKAPTFYLSVVSSSVEK